jgi:hypothetical protein
MQVTKKAEFPSYDPITLHITLESAEEQQLINDMLCWNMTIPDLVAPDDKAKQVKLTSMMNHIREMINQ